MKDAWGIVIKMNIEGVYREILSCRTFETRKAARDWATHKNLSCGNLIRYIPVKVRIARIGR